MMTEDRVYNFSAGPSILPEEVLQRAKAEIMNYHGSGMSVMEMSHRSPVFSEIFSDTKAKFRSMLRIPETHEILFLQGGATLQFAAIPMNLMEGGTADYAVTGNFSKKAAKEAEKYGTVHIAYDTGDTGHNRIPNQEELRLSPEARYFYYCANNTIYTGPSGSMCPRRKRLWSAICPRTSSRARWKSPGSALFMPAPRRTWPRPDSRS